MHSLASDLVSTSNRKPDILGLDYAALGEFFKEQFGKGDFHAGALFRELYREGRFDPLASPAFTTNLALAQSVENALHFSMPEIVCRQVDGDTYKFLIRLHDGLESESVVIPMRRYKTLCISSQVGCKMGCTFCETAQLGFLRHLTAGEIVGQVFAAKHILNEPIDNIVFMGMGEPLDNFDEIVKALRVIRDQRGFDIALPYITISTVGHVDGIRKLAALVRQRPPEGLWRLRLAVSLNAPNDEIRGSIMPINSRWNMEELREALLEWPLPQKDDFIFVEYVIIPGINDGENHARQLATYLKGLRVCVNLIPYNPRRESPFNKPERASVQAFFKVLMGEGQATRIRGTKGQEAMAACGQLGNRNLSRKNRLVEVPI